MEKFPTGPRFPKSLIKRSINFPLGYLFQTKCLFDRAKGGFFSESAMKLFQISKSKKKIFQKNYPELEI